MLETTELNALLTLIDDPDQEVYTTVTEKIVEYGKPIIPNLEHLWEITSDEEVQERIEMLIHRLHFTDLITDFTEWADSAYHDLLFGALLVSKYQYPELQTTPVILDIEKISRNVWLDLNTNLTPLEQANVLSSILYNHYKLKGLEVNYSNPDEFFLHKVLETKKGNALANGILYQIMCEKLSIDARIINIPKQCILAFYFSGFPDCGTEQHAIEDILFYVDATNGQAFAQQDIENYLNRISVPISPAFFKPMPYKKVIKLLLQEIAKCFDNPLQEYKKEELLQLAKLLS